MMAELKGAQLLMGANNMGQLTKKMQQVQLQHWSQ